MKISIFGAGYVGLVTGTCFSELGNEVMCHDIDLKKIENLQNGVIPIYEPGLEELVLRNVRDKRLLFSTSPQEAVKFGEIIFIAVGTPSKEYGQADLSFVFNVAAEIGSCLDESGKIIVVKSTVPVGTNGEIEKIIKESLSERNLDIDFAVASNPEFLKEGEAIDDFMKPDRIVVGVEKKWAKNKMKELYMSLADNGHPIFFVDIATSEMSKYAANAMLATKISFINQVANLCDIVGADVEGVRKIICADERIGKHFLQPGVGYGGSCFPKDVQALAVLAKKHGYLPHLLEAVEQVNEAQKDLMAKKIIKKLENVEDKKIAIWGLSFKPKTDDMRYAPAINLIEKLIAKGVQISAYDPIALHEAKKVFGNRITYCLDMYECLQDADALVIVTEWPQFKEPDFLKMKKLLKKELIFDGRNIYSPAKMEELGFGYIGIGRPEVKKESPVKTNV